MNPFDAFVSAPATGWGAFGSLAILVVVSVVRGWLVPKGTHERELAASDRRGDEWKETALETRKTNNLLIQANEIVNDFFRKVTVTRSPNMGDNEHQEVR